MANNFKKYLITLDTNMNIVDAEESFLRYIGMPELTMLDLVIPPQDMMLLKNTIFAINVGGTTLSCFRIRTASGTLNWIAANIEKLSDGSNLVRMELSDIQTLKSDSASSRIDTMTGLLNKAAIAEITKGLTLRPDSNFYFCLLDIDHFKRVNDTLGHMKGDEVITEVAHLVRDCVGSEGVVGRFGGDEFMIIFENVNQKPHLRTLLGDIREHVEKKYSVSENDLHLTVSIGAALYPDYAKNYDDLFRLTDRMLYRAKEKGRNRYIIYTPEVHGDILGTGVTNIVPVQRIYTEKEKHRLMFDLMENFLLNTETPLDIALTTVVQCYNIDEAYIFYDDRFSSVYGVRSTPTKEDPYQVLLSETTISFLHDPESVMPEFGENNTVLLVLEGIGEHDHGLIPDYMIENDIRFFLAYRMEKSRIPGFVVYINRSNSTSRPSEADISDLLYFARMVELTQIRR